MRACIVYFSRAGENYLDGEVKSLESGNTKVLAEMIRKFSGLPTFELEPLESYPVDYEEATQKAQRERMRDQSVPYKKTAICLRDFEGIILVYPNWWGSFPQIIKTFLLEADMVGKWIYPFCTHEGSGFGSSLSELQQLCPTATIKDGLPVRGSRVCKAEPAVKNWLTAIEQWEDLSENTSNR